jgi:hypothetical protein
MRDDEFTFDRSIYQEIREPVKDPNSNAVWKYLQSEPEICNLVYTQITGFTISVPYIAYSGMDNYLTIFNMDAPQYVHRVQLA